MPSFTICPKYSNGFKNDVLDQNYSLEIYDVLDFTIFNGTFFEKITYDLSEIMKWIKIKIKGKYFDSNVIQINFNASGIFTKPRFKLEAFRLINWHTMGRCYSFKLPNEIHLLKVSFQGK